MTLKHPSRLRELGTALFLDRPLGCGKLPGQVDRTPLLSYEAFSHARTIERLRQLTEWGLLSAERSERLLAGVDQAVPSRGAGRVFSARGEPPVVAYDEDAQRAPRFRLSRALTRGSLGALLDGYDLSPLATRAEHVWRWLTTATDVLLIRTADSGDAEPAETIALAAFDRDQGIRLRFVLPRSTARWTISRPPAGDYCRGGLTIVEVEARPCGLVCPARRLKAAFDDLQ